MGHVGAGTPGARVSVRKPSLPLATPGCSPPRPPGPRSPGSDDCSGPGDVL